MSYVYNQLNPLLNAIFNPNPTEDGTYTHNAKLNGIRRTLTNNWRNYTLLVPRTSVLAWNVDRDSGLPLVDLCATEDFVASHIINTPSQERSNQRTRYHGTLNGKTVVVKDGYIYTHKGFKNFVRASIVSERLFYPATPLMPLEVQLVVYELDVPLVGVPMPGKDISATIQSKYEVASMVSNTGAGPEREKKGRLPSLATADRATVGSGAPAAAGGITLAPAGSPQLLSLPPSGAAGSPGSVLTDSSPPLSPKTSKADRSMGMSKLRRRSLETLLSAYPALSRQILGPLLMHVDAFDCSSIKVEKDLLKFYDHFIDTSLQIFQHGDPGLIAKLAQENDLNGEDMADVISQFVESRISGKLWNKVTEIRSENDAELFRAMEAIKDVDIAQIDLPEEVTECHMFQLNEQVFRATTELQKLANFSSADDKIDILVSVLQILSKESVINASGVSTVMSGTGSADSSGHGAEVFSNGSMSGGSPLSGGTVDSAPTSPQIGIKVNADVLLSLLVLVVSRSGLKNMDSELFYVQSFTYRDVENGPLGYALLTMEGVEYHIRNETAKLSALARANKRIWQAIKDGTFNVVAGETSESSTTTPTINGSDEPITMTKEEGNEKREEDTETGSNTSTKTTTEIVSSKTKSRNIKERLPELLSDVEDETHAVSVLKSRTATGESPLAQAIYAKNPKILESLLGLTEIFTLEYVVSDASADFSKTLLMLAVEINEEECTRILLKYLGDRLDENAYKDYLARRDYWNRTVAHYFFHLPWLINEIGQLVDWEYQDRNGQTPLLTLCRSYDNPNYNELVRLGFEAWDKSVSPKKKPSILDHVDSKGNSLLHVINDPEALKIVLKYDIDVNWPNARNQTPLMVFSKFSRVEVVGLLAKDPRIDIERTDHRGFNCLDYAKDPVTTNLLDEGLDQQAVKVTRALVQNNELMFVLKSGTRRHPCSTITVKRSISDFMFMQKWLSYESPYSWIHTLTLTRNPFAVSAQVCRQVLQEQEIRLTAFLRVLLQHPTFGKHELLWEFLMVQEMSQQQCIDRCRGKLESRKEAQHGEVTIYSPADLETIQLFFDHATSETNALSFSLQKVSRCLMKLKNKTEDYYAAHRVFADKLNEVQSLKNIRRRIFEPEFSIIYDTQDRHTLEHFALEFLESYVSSEAVVAALVQPVNLIQQLKQEESALDKLTIQLEKVASKSTWQFGLLEDRRQKDLRIVQDKIYQKQDEIRRISNDIKYAHVTLASELGGFYKIQQQEVTRAIRNFAADTIRQQKEQLHLLDRIKGKFDTLCDSI